MAGQVGVAKGVAVLPYPLAEVSVASVAEAEGRGVAVRGYSPH